MGLESSCRTVTPETIVPTTVPTTVEQLRYELSQLSIIGVLPAKPVVVPVVSVVTRPTGEEQLSPLLTHRRCESDTCAVGKVRSDGEQRRGAPRANTHRTPLPPTPNADCADSQLERNPRLWLSSRHAARRH